MVYAALTCFVIGVAVLVLGFLGVARGAAGIANAALLLSLLLLAAGSLPTIRRSHAPR